MNPARGSRPRAAWAVMVLGALACTAALAVDTTAAASAQARYRQERAVCASGLSNQDRSTCLREAGAAYAQARKGALDDGAAPYARNALQRCERLPDEDRRACIARMRGQGTTSGSVAGGGIYRELVTRETGVPASVLPDAPPAPTQ